ncbi:MAG TPA: DUF2652 domain-containing protein [Promineifilum sp.]|nr:DUF2652 domain-containing protein [Promineifilum sp.]HRO91597.1 DUF2652 domain-containing protein [Promineifilum sp.]HRQ14793.1 DUF2652 domain-containing protein [Promineifilum sp.]
MNKIQTGTLLIADITGYTLFLNESELAHAQEILTTLLNILIKQTRPPLIISRTAGDAVISYSLGGTHIQGQTFIELLEDTYIAFRRAIELMVLNNRCQCAACANVGALDLKFFVHNGEFAIQKLGDHDELVGNEVNQLHRLLKNHIVDALGIRAYTVYTAAAVDALGLGEIAAAMTPHVEEYEHLGEVKVFVQDMKPIWEARRDSTFVDIPPKDILFSVSRDFPLPPHLLWNALTEPETRNLLMGSVSTGVDGRKEGRLAEGTTLHCNHGDSTTEQLILTWRPFEMMLTEDDPSMAGVTVLDRLRLMPVDGGTRLEVSFGMGKGNPIARQVVGAMLRMKFKGQIAGRMERLRERLTAQGLETTADR